MQFGDNLNEEADEEMDVSDNEDEFPGPRKKCRNDKEVEIGALKVRFYHHHHHCFQVFYLRS